MDRLKALGNVVIPQVAEAVGRLVVSDARIYFPELFGAR